MLGVTVPYSGGGDGQAGCCWGGGGGGGLGCEERSACFSDDSRSDAGAGDGGRDGEDEIDGEFVAGDEGDCLVEDAGADEGSDELVGVGGGGGGLEVGGVSAGEWGSEKGENGSEKCGGRGTGGGGWRAGKYCRMVEQVWSATRAWTHGSCSSVHPGFTSATAGCSGSLRARLEADAAAEELSEEEMMPKAAAAAGFLWMLWDMCKGEGGRIQVV